MGHLYLTFITPVFRLYYSYLGACQLELDFLYPCEWLSESPVSQLYLTCISPVSHLYLTCSYVVMELMDANLCQVIQIDCTLPVLHLYHTCISPVVTW